jgi:hypothetical protein
MRRHDGSDFIHPRNLLRSILSLIVIIAVLWPYSFSVGATEATFTLVNKTTRYLHAIVNNKPSVYIAPGAVVTYDVSGYGSVVAEVRYSPGQGVKGTVLRSFSIVFHSSSNAESSSNCNNSRGSSTCSSSTESEGTVSADPVIWEVTENDLELN